MTLLDPPTDFDQWNPNVLVGLPLMAAELEATDHGRTTRVVEINGESHVVTRDYNPRRINLHVVNEVITAITEG